jgi:uncharacterized membrane protein HdeD (DUF308 family)
MSTSPYLAGEAEVRRQRGWLIGLGIALTVLGILALAASVATTVVSVALLGGILIVGGLAQIVHAFSAPRWSGVFLELLAGVLYLVVGTLTVARPLESAAMLTLLIAAFFMVAGLFRVFAAPIIRMANWGWVLASGVVGLLLGMAIWAQWPVSGLWVIGAFIGIEMIVHGIELAMLGTALREPPRAYARREAA